MYRLSKNKRKHSTTPIVRVTEDANGKEVEEIICLVTLPKNEGNPLAELICDLLNAEGIKILAKYINDL